MNTHEQRLCELQADIFESSAEVFKCSSPYFVARFMKSAIVNKLDNTSDSYNYMSITSMLFMLRLEYPSLCKKEGLHYPPQVLRWIGYIYRAYSILKKRGSHKIYKQLKVEKLLTLYEAFHTFSVEYCVDQLEILINEKNETPKSDYEIFKLVMDAK